MKIRIFLPLKADCCAGPVRWVTLADCLIEEQCEERDQKCLETHWAVNTVSVPSYIQMGEIWLHNLQQVWLINVIFLFNIKSLMEPLTGNLFSKAHSLHCNLAKWLGAFTSPVIGLVFPMKVKQQFSFIYLFLKVFLTNKIILTCST